MVSPVAPDQPTNLAHQTLDKAAQSAPARDKSGPWADIAADAYSPGAKIPTSDTTNMVSAPSFRADMVQQFGGTGDATKSQGDAPGPIGGTRTQTLDSAFNVLTNRFGDIDTDHNGRLNSAELQVAAGDSAHFSPEERAALGFAATNYDKLQHLSDDALGINSQLGISKTDLAVLHRAVHPEDTKAPNPFTDAEYETAVNTGLIGSVATPITAIVGVGLGGIPGMIIGAAAPVLIVGGITELAEKIRYGNGEQFYAKEAGVLNSLQY